MTNEDVKNGKLTAAKERMGKENDGLSRGSVECRKGVLRQRNVMEEIESLKAIYSRKKGLNSFESLIPWRP